MVENAGSRKPRTRHFVCHNPSCLDGPRLLISFLKESKPIPPIYRIGPVFVFDEAFIASCESYNYADLCDLGIILEAINNGYIAFRYN
jgi:hypothetical protein